MAIDPGREGDALGRLLVARRIATAAQIEAARKEALVRGGRLATALLALDAVDLDTLASALGEVHDLEVAGPDDFAAIAEEAIAAVPPKIAVRHLAVPFRVTKRALSVAFVDPTREAVGALEEAAGRPVRAHIAPEPLVYSGLSRHFGLARVPKPLEKLVQAIAAGTVRRHAGAIPEDPEEYVTTPMGGVVPHLPDEVTTNPLLAAATFSPEDVLLGAGGDDPFGRTLAAIAFAKDLRAAMAAVLDFARGSGPAAALLCRTDGEWRIDAAAGALEEAVGRTLGEARRSVLDAALGIPDGLRGAPPDTPANALLLAALDREPDDLFVVTLHGGRRGEECVLWLDGGDDGHLDGERVEELRTLARRVRSRFDERATRP